MEIVASTASLIGVSLGLAIISYFLIRHSRRYFAQQDPSRPTGRGRSLAICESVPRSAPVELARWEVQLHDTARDLMGELDSKMRALQVLIRMADESSARLERAIAESGSRQTQVDG